MDFQRSHNGARHTLESKEGYHSIETFGDMIADSSLDSLRRQLTLPPQSTLPDMGLGFFNLQRTTGCFPSAASRRSVMKDPAIGNILKPCPESPEKTMMEKTCLEGNQQ